MAKNKDLHSEETWKSGSGGTRTPRNQQKREWQWVNKESKANPRKNSKHIEKGKYWSESLQWVGS